jgi:magnesium-transporting ATPase (P-type)
MDELELLKKDWNKGASEFKNYSETEIQPMLHKKSSSIVKTLFYISIAEFVFWIFLNAFPYFVSDSYRKKLEVSYENPLFLVITVISLAVVFIFMYLLYKSHKLISSTDSSKQLMESILKTRKVVKYYVMFNLVLIFITVPLTLYFEYNQNLEFHDEILAMDSTQTLIFYIITVVTTGVLLLLFWLFYRLIYGILLKRLNRNYNELKKLEV